MKRDKPCKNNSCEYNCKDAKLLNCNAFNNGYHCIHNCTGYIDKPLLINDRDNRLIVKHGYYLKPCDIEHKVSLLDRLRAALLVFTQKAYAQLWYNNEEINEKLKSLVSFHKERVAPVDCATTDCDGYDPACNLNCIYNHKVMMMCQIYTPEHRI